MRLPVLIATIALAGCPVWGTDSSSSHGGPRNPTPDPPPQLPTNDAGLQDPPPPSDPVDAGPSSCRTHGDCPAGAYCSEGLCSESSTCTVDADCTAEGFACDFRNTCAPLAPGACREPSDCESGTTCVEGQCRSNEDLCQFNYQCGPARACVDNACVDLCGSDDACGSGTSCQGGFCRPVDECESSAACGSGEHCVDGRCLPDCAEDSTCDGSSDVCAEDSFCRPDWSTRTICDADSDCQPGHVCKDGYCRTPCPGGTSAECLSFDVQLPICAEDNLCYSSNETSPECFGASDCADDGDSCIDAICR